MISTLLLILRIVLLSNFIQTVADGLHFTQIVVNDEMNAFRVFETLNARGVPR